MSKKQVNSLTLIIGHNRREKRSSPLNAPNQVDQWIEMITIQRTARCVLNMLLVMIQVAIKHKQQYIWLIDCQYLRVKLSGGKHTKNKNINVNR